MDISTSGNFLSVGYILLTTVLIADQARSEDLAAAQEERPILYKQELEGVYFNSWTGMKVSGSPGNQVDVHVLGEGKSVDFNGILSINCSSGSGYFWKTASNFHESLSEVQITEIVPIEVVAKSNATFCD
jgi:hypothetical protein